MKKFIPVCCLLAILVSVTACNRQSPEKAQEGTTSPQAVAPQPAATVKSGIVKETMDSGGYTYVLVDTDGLESWIAIPQSTVTVGQEVSYYDGMVMQNFESKSLGRTFDSVVFSSGLVETGLAGGASSFADAISSEGRLPSSDPMAEGSAKASVPFFSDIKVDKASGANAHTVAEIFEKATELAGQRVTVRGQVMKVTPKIMGMTWYHIQDGTGNPETKTHDLVVTTDAMPLDDATTVTVEGVVAADKDFGAGYKYAVIIEEATVTP